MPIDAGGRRGLERRTRREVTSDQLLHTGIMLASWGDEAGLRAVIDWAEAPSGDAILRGLAKTKSVRDDADAALARRARMR